MILKQWDRVHIPLQNTIRPAQFKHSEKQFVAQSSTMHLFIISTLVSGLK